MRIITPPIGTTSDSYHNRACDIKFEIKKIKKEIKQLTEKERYLQQEYDNNISARDNSRRYENRM